MKVGDQVRTLVPRSGIPAGSVGFVIDAHEEEQKYKFIDATENDYQAWFNIEELEQV